MANTTLQNCQRAIIFMELLTLVSVALFLTIKLIKKRIDLTKPEQQQQNQKPGEGTASKYKEQPETSMQQFEKKAEKATVFTEDDTCTQRFIKKVCEYNVIFHPLLITLALNFVLGRSMAFVVSIYFFCACCCLLLNVFKVHRACIEYKISRLSLQILWMVLSVLLLINIWLTASSTMPYLIKSN